MRARRLQQNPEEAQDLKRTGLIATHVRLVTQDLRTAARLFRVEEAVVLEKTSAAEVEIERSRKEMRYMKEAAVVMSECATQLGIMRPRWL